EDSAQEDGRWAVFNAVERSTTLRLASRSLLPINVGKRHDAKNWQEAVTRPWLSALLLWESLIFQPDRAFSLRCTLKCKRYHTGTNSPRERAISFSCTLQKNRPATNNPIRQSS